MTKIMKQFRSTSAPQFWRAVFKCLHSSVRLFLRPELRPNCLSWRSQWSGGSTQRKSLANQRYFRSDSCWQTGPYPGVRRRCVKQPTLPLPSLFPLRYFWSNAFCLAFALPSIFYCLYLLLFNHLSLLVSSHSRLCDRAEVAPTDRNRDRRKLSSREPISCRADRSTELFLPVENVSQSRRLAVTSALFTWDELQFEWNHFPLYSVK